MRARSNAIQGLDGRLVARKGRVRGMVCTTEEPRGRLVNVGVVGASAARYLP